MNGNSRNLDWVKIKLEYIHDSTLTLQAVADKYNASMGSVRWHCHRYQWNEERSTYQQKLAARLAAAATPRSAAAILAERNDQTLKWTAEMRYAINMLLKERGGDGVVGLRKDIAQSDIYKAVLSYAELNRLDRLALGASTENVQATTAQSRIDEMTDAEVMAELKRLREQVTVQ